MGRGRGATPGTICQLSLEGDLCCQRWEKVPAPSSLLLSAPLLLGPRVRAQHTVPPKIEESRSQPLPSPGPRSLSPQSSPASDSGLQTPAWTPCGSLGVRPVAPPFSNSGALCSWGRDQTLLSLLAAGQPDEAGGSLSTWPLLPQFGIPGHHLRKQRELHGCPGGRIALVRWLCGQGLVSLGGGQCTRSLTLFLPHL